MSKELEKQEEYHRIRAELCFEQFSRTGEVFLVDLALDELRKAWECADKQLQKIRRKIA